MRSRDVVGRRIVAVEQSRHVNGMTGRRVVALDALVLDNGDRIAFSAHEDDTGSWVEASIYRKAKS
jgi:hypothetical protein